MNSITITRKGLMAIADRYGYTLSIVWRTGVYITKGNVTVLKKTYGQAYSYIYDQNRKHKHKAL